MGANNLIAWYQNKIGHYDEQIWEKQIEHKKYYRFSPVDLKTSNLKPGLIDLDLVRGSSFTKAKPKHGLLTVLKLATLRILFLPFHLKWWILQTSTKVAFCLLLVYIMQMFNVYLYYYLIDKQTDNDDIQISFAEVFVPLFMMWTLSMIHSQIVSTNPGSEKSYLKQSQKNMKKKYARNNYPPNKSNNDLLKPLVTDDGFESFNGNGTSNSDNNESLLEYKHGCKRQLLCANRKFKKTQIHGTSSDEEGSNSDIEHVKKSKVLFKKRKSCLPQIASDISDEEELMNAASVRLSSQNGNILLVDCLGATTNSEEECSYASDFEDYKNQCDSLFEGVPSCINSSEKVSCLIWHVAEIKEASLSVLDIISAIITRVESVPENVDYFYFGVFLSTTIALTPAISRFFASATEVTALNDFHLVSFDGLEKLIYELINAISYILSISFGNTFIERVIMISVAIQRWLLAFLFFFLLSVAERTYKHRFLYAKFFSHLTSSRRARKSELPHFRLNKVLNIKIWLAARSYLKKKGPQRSVDIIVSSAFMIAFLLFLFVSIDLIPCNLDAIIWCTGLGIWLLRFMTLGTQINRKYVNRNLSILTTEQINLHLQIEQNSGRKEELTVANNVLKLAADLLKDMESPFQILGISANPYLYAIIKLVMLSALSGVLSDLLGFKLKLHKIKVK